MSDRYPKPGDPTAERTAENSTQSASGLTGGRSGAEQARRSEDEDEGTPRNAEDRAGTPRREEASDRDPVMPNDDASLGTKI